MSHIKLDLKSFKHVKSDDKSTTLRHKDGHELTIANKAMSPEAQAQLKALAKLAPTDETPPQKQEAQAAMADGGEVPHLLSEPKQEQNPKLEESKKEPQLYKAPKSETKYEDKPNKGMGGIKHRLAEGGDITPDSACYACGGPVHKMANGGVVDNTVELADAPAQVPSAPPAALSPNDPNTPAYDVQTGDVDLKNLSKAQAKDVEENKAAKAIEQQKNLAELRANAGIVDPNSAPPNVTPEQQAMNHLNELRKVAGLPPNPVPPTPPQVDAVNPPQPDSQDKLQQASATDQVQPSSAIKQSGLTEDPSSMLSAGYQGAAAGAGQEAQALGQIGQQQAGVLQHAADVEQQATSNYKQTFDQLNNERLAHIEDIKAGYINPDKYWTGDPTTGEGGHSKVMSALGMIIAGFNPTGNPNAAINMLKYQMDKNIEAQRQNLGAKQNLLTANLHQFGNLKDATDMTRVMQNDIASHQLQMIAAKNASPLAQAAAQKAIGQLQMEAAPKFMEFGMRRAMLNAMNSGGGANNPGAAEKMLQLATISNPELAKTMRAAYVPGVGMSASYSEVPDSARKQIIASKSVNDLMNMSLQFSKQHAGTLSPALRNQAETIHNQLIGSIKQAQGDGVYKEAEAEFLLKQIGNSPASFAAALNSVPRIKQMQSIKQQEYNNLLKTYNLPQQQLPQTGMEQPNHQAALKWAKSNPKDPRAAKILQLQGQ